MASYFAGVVQAPLTALVIVGGRESLYQTLARPFMGIHDRRGMHRGR